MKDVKIVDLKEYNSKEVGLLVQIVLIEILLIFAVLTLIVSEFLNAFLDFATKSWADKFNLYTGQKIDFTGIQPAKSGQFFVTSVVQNNPPAEVLWRLKKVGNTYKITDIVIEGVSMVTSYRNEYTAFLHKNGGKLSTLTQELKTKSAAFKMTKKAQ